MASADFESARVAVLGVGREGQAAWRYLRAVYPALHISLLAETPAEASFTKQLGKNDCLLIGPLAEAGLEEFDFLVRSPGISLYRSCIQQALDAGVCVTSSSNLWFEQHRKENTIAITGTKGKSTTSALLAHMLLSCGFKVRLAGNIGLPLLACDDRGVDWWVIEFSSYQLADLEASPSIGVILNLSSEHLDWHGSEQTYRRDKLRLAGLCGSRPLVANALDPVLCAALPRSGSTVWFNTISGFRVEGGRLFDGETELPLQVPEGLPGAHNLSNIAAALTVLRAIGADVTTGIRCVESFQCLPHRLQIIGERAGVRFIDDSISSAPVATLAALEAFSGQPVTLLVGGLDRGLDWTPHMAGIKARMPEAVIGMPDSGHRIVNHLRQAGIRPRNGLHESINLAEAVELAQRLSTPGGIVLLSPGAPSFPRFRDYRDRGRQFVQFCGFEPEDYDPGTAG